MCFVIVKELSLNTLDDIMLDLDSEGVFEFVELSDEDVIVKSYFVKFFSKLKL